MPETHFWWRDYPIVAGADIGKHGNPSHFSAFAVTDSPDKVTEKGTPVQILKQVSQKWMDAWDYTKQVEYFKAAIDYLNIQRMYLDNTRGEMEERGLPRQVIPIVLSTHDGPKSKGKMGLATEFAKMVEQRAIELIDDDRFISQILCVTNDLQAASTPMGHADSFISVILAVGVFKDFFSRERRTGFMDIGDLQQILVKEDRITNLIDKKLLMGACKICGNKKLDLLPNGKKICPACFAQQ